MVAERNERQISLKIAFTAVPNSLFKLRIIYVGLFNLASTWPKMFFVCVAQ